MAPAQTQGGHCVRNLTRPTKKSQPSSQVPDEAAIVVGKQLLLWRGHQWWRVLENFLLESLSMQCVKPSKGHVIHSLRRQVLRSPSVPICGSDFAWVFYMTGGTHSLILCPPAAGKFQLQSWMQILLWAGSRPTMFPPWGADCLLSPAQCLWPLAESWE